MNIFRVIVLIIIIFVPVSLFAADVLKQDMSIRLLPEEQTLQAEVRVTRSSDDMDWPREYYLARQTKITSISVDGKPLVYDFRSGLLKLLVAREVEVLTLEYSIRFDDEVPQDIVGIEDPSYGVNGTITSEGAYLSASSGWHPKAVGVDNLFKVRIVGDGQLAGVTNGRMTGYKLTGDSTIVTWESALPQSAMSLAAGYYELDRRQLGDIQVLVFLTNENSSLVSGYLDSVTEHLSLYQELFGPYPYEKFAVVENFYPTGYGLPGWTLIGKRVIRLPFIRTSSLPHEIAHAWWGNSVEIDYGSGNWGEGLATYVADYYLKELSNPAEAKEYRRKLVRDYASLVSAVNDMPLVDFRRRMSKSDQAIGYGKSAMLFHMLRERIGDDSFWLGLQNIAKKGRSQRFGWDDLKKHFEKAAQEDLQGFFSQWLERPGAPLLKLSDVDVIKVGDEWQVSGNIRQGLPVYDLAVPLLLETEGRQYRQVVGLYEEFDCFVFTVADQPLRLSLDPDNTLFRRLYKEELPATINDLRASQAQLVVIADGFEELYRASRDLLKGLHWLKADVVSEKEFAKLTPANSDILVLGRPKLEALQPEAKRISSEEKHEFKIPDKMIPEDEVLFMVNSRKDPGQGVIAHYLPGSLAAAMNTSRRISHYGRYSYLTFKGGINQLKGTWEPGVSPLKVWFKKD